MFAKVAALCLFATVLAAPAPDSPVYQPPQPSYQPQQRYQEPAPQPASYNFDWAVNDDQSGNNFGQSESRDGYNTQGSYYVALPDGRLQRVTYSVNGDSGYVAEVTYEGEASYPQAQQSYQPQPSYQPAPQPSYQPAPEPPQRYN